MFLAKSKYLKKIKNIADMAKELKLNIFIYGEKGTGKTYLAKYIAPNAVVNPKTTTLNPIILEEDFENIEKYKNHNDIIIGISTKPLQKEIIEKYFDLEIELKPLKEHPEDIEEFIDFFIKKAQKELKINKTINISNPDIRENLNSLKRQVYKTMLFENNKELILEELFNYYQINHSTYEQELKDFEKTLFSAMKEKYKSKLKISEELKINRVTLTKKMKALNV